MYARDVQRWHYEDARRGEARGNEKMQLRSRRLRKKSARKQLASNFSRLSLSHPLAPSPTLSRRTPLFLYSPEQTCASNAVVLWPVYIFISVGRDDISRSPNKRDSGFSGHLSCPHRRE